MFTKGPKGWQQTAELVASGTAPGDEFGASVAVSGRTIVVGAPGHGPTVLNQLAGGVGAQSGRAYVFQKRATGWHEAGMLGDPGRTTRRNGYLYGTSVDFGTSVAVSGNTAVVGAYGQAYVFTERRAGWHYATELVKVPFQTLTCCEAVAVSGATAVVSNERYGVDPKGAPLATSDAIYALNEKGLVRGVAYVFSNSPTGWHETGELDRARPDTAADYLGSGPYYGASVAISGSTAAVGAPQFPAGLLGELEADWQTRWSVRVHPDRLRLAPGGSTCQPEPQLRLVSSRFRQPGGRGGTRPGAITDGLYDFRRRELPAGAARGGTRHRGRLRLHGGRRWLAPGCQAVERGEAKR